MLKSARREAGDEIRSRNLGEKALDGLELMRRYLDEVRYSNRTNESYLAVLELFFKYFHEKDPLTISMDEVSEFVYKFIVTNIRITDLDRDRSIVHIREGKGRVDRIVPVSKKVWEKLDEYIDGFHPGSIFLRGSRERGIL